MIGSAFPATSNGVVRLQPVRYKEQIEPAQFMVMSVDQDQPIGLVWLYGQDFANGFASVAVVRFPTNDRSLRMTSATLLFLEYSFSSWPFRKLYFHASEVEVGRYRAALKTHLQTEARLKDHTFAAGRYWDRFTLCLFREQWERAQFEFRALIGVES